MRPSSSLQGQLLRFILVGVLAFLVNAGLVEWLYPRAGAVGAQAVAFPAAASVAWALNRRYTFGASARPWHEEWLRYLAANGFGWIANNALYTAALLMSADARRWPVLAVAAGSLAGLGFNFGLARWVVFRTSTAPPAR